jgi:hypothetical protein
MKSLRNALLNLKSAFGTIALLDILVSLGAISLTRASAPTVTITVVNNSNWEIRHLYLSPANTDNWGDDQLGQSSIAPGSSRTLTVSWEQSTVKLVGEDQDGCFLTKTVEASGTQVWTIGNGESRNCGN